VLCLFLPDGATPKEDFEHVEQIGKEFDLQWKQIVIAPIVEAIQQVYMYKDEKMVISNIKARTRMMLLYAHANSTKSLVCGTSNKSELLVGYFTKYGDGGVDFQPLGDLYKTQICQLGAHLRLPRSLLLKPPTAGLWRGQTDEKELKMSYETLDKILYGLEQKLNIKEIQKQANVKRSEVERIRKMRKTSQHKRRSPLIPKIGLRTVGLDWRSPVQEG
jgi:NAD+ synthase